MPDMTYDEAMGSLFPLPGQVPPPPPPIDPARMPYNPHRFGPPAPLSPPPLVNTCLEVPVFKDALSDNPCKDAVIFETIEIPGPDMKYDKGKADWTLTPWKSVEAVVRVMMFGEEKYERNSWQTVPNGKRRYLAAAFRHLTQHCLGEEIDEESGFSHLAHAATNILFLIHLHNETK